MIAYNLKNARNKSQCVTNRAELCFKAWTKKDLHESLNLSLKLGTNLERFLHHRCNTRVFKARSLNATQDLQGQCKTFKVPLAHYGYALAKIHNKAWFTPSKQTRFDVIRSPFVFKKTREQFGLAKHAISVKLNLNPQEQAHLQSQLSMLRLPGELTCIFTN